MFGGECTWSDKLTPIICWRMNVTWQVNNQDLVENEHDLTSEQLRCSRVRTRTFSTKRKVFTCQVTYLLHQIWGVHLSGHVHYPPSVRCSLVRSCTFSTKYEVFTCQVMSIINQMLVVHLSGQVHSPPNVRCSLVRSFQRRRSLKFQPIRAYYWPWQPCWISDWNEKQKLCRGPSKEHSC
jgi:hypothetical protein